MDPIRFATPEEIKAIAEKSDLTQTSQVVTFGGKDFAVLRQCWEIDPMFFAETSNVQRKLWFASNLETFMRLNGVSEVYFNVPVKDEGYLKVLDTWGAKPTSMEPELRLKKVL